MDRKNPLSSKTVLFNSIAGIIVLGLVALGLKDDVDELTIQHVSAGIAAIAPYAVNLWLRFKTKKAVSWKAPMSAE